MALLTQNPGDYLVRERVGDELPGEQGAAALRAVGLEHARRRATPATSPAASGSGWRWRSRSPGAWMAMRSRAWSPSTSRRGAWTVPARASWSR